MSGFIINSRLWLFFYFIFYFFGSGACRDAAVLLEAQPGEGHLPKL